MTRWNQRYQHCSSSGEPCWVLQHHQHLLPSTGRSLDLACGLGANALLLARRGLESHAWDNSTTAIEKLATFTRQQQLIVHTAVRDIESYPPEPAGFEVIVVSRFLYRPIFPALVKALLPGGLLFYQTFHNNKVSDQGPGNPDYLLQRGELLQQLSDLQLVFYREDSRIGQLDQGLRDCSYFIGQKCA